MFFKQMFLSIVVFSSVIVHAHARNDAITFPTADREVKVTPCQDCPIPGKECRSYIATSTDKICFPSHTSTNKTLVENAGVGATLHEEANKEDSRILESDLNYPASRTSDSVVDTGAIQGNELLVK